MPYGVSVSLTIRVAAVTEDKAEIELLVTSVDCISLAAPCSFCTSPTILRFRYNLFPNDSGMGNITGQVELLIHWRFNAAVQIREREEKDKAAAPKAGFMGTLKRMFHMSTEDDADLDVGDDVSDCDK